MHRFRRARGLLRPFFRAEPPLTGQVPAAAEPPPDGGGGGTPPAPAGDNAGAQTVTLTKEELQQRIDAAAAAGRRDGEARAAQRQTPPPPAPKPAPVVPDKPKTVEEQLSDLREEMRLARTEQNVLRLIARHKLPETASARLTKLFDAEQPQDGDAWIETLRSEGLLPPKPTSTEQAGSQNQQKVVPPGNGNGAPKPPNPGLPGIVPGKVPVVGATELIDVFDNEAIAHLSDEQVVEAFEKSRMRAMLGKGAPPKPKAVRPKG